jgi:hypothetical protein
LESAAEGALEVAGFVPVKLATSEAVKGTVAIEVRRGAVQVKVSWPLGGED